MIFVFGSNLAGIHGAGAALFAHKNRGAIWHLGRGRAGESYAIPTKDHDIKTLPLDVIKKFVDIFLIYARNHPHLTFQVTRIGCGLAGFKDAEVAPLFKAAPNNCLFDEAWRQYLPNHNFWKDSWWDS